MSIFDDEITLRMYTQNSISYSEIIRKFGLDPRGCNFKTLKFYLKKFNIDTTHLLGQSHGTSTKNKFKSLDDVLIEGTILTSKHKQRLLNNGLLLPKCYICNITNWLNNPISLQIDHINGNSFDNRIENLRILCPNCHSQTDTFAGRNRKVKTSNKTLGKKINNCSICNEPCCKLAKFCDVCYNNQRKNKIVWPSIDDLKSLVKQHGYLGSGKILGVSDNAIRKRIIRYSDPTES